MPESILKALLATPTCTLDALEPVEQLVFVIDLGIEPDALASLYQLGEPFEPTLLFKDSEFEALAWQGPCSFSAAPGSVLADKAAALCLAKRCGMVLAAANPEQAVAHVRTLLKVNDGSGGQSLLSLGNPHLWAALALTADAQAPRLFGPLSQVLTPVPAHLEVAEQPWYLWPSPGGAPVAESHWPYQLPQGFVSASRSVRLLYQLDAQHEAFGSPRAGQALTAVANLQTLVNHGIIEGRHLLTLANQVNGPLLADDAQAMAILRGSETHFIKLEQLARLAGHNGQ